MTITAMALTELAEKGADIDVVRFMAQRLMELDVQARRGAGYDEKGPERLNSRNGYRERTWETRVGSVALTAPSTSVRGDCRRRRCDGGSTRGIGWVLGGSCGGGFMVVGKYFLG